MYEVTYLLLLVHVWPLQPGTVPSPSTVVPSVKILALKVNFGVLRDVKMTVAYLGCFPNIDTLHIEVISLYPMQLFNQLLDPHTTIY